ncbi:MAG: SecDF P1 head subdomain-containing protein [Nannocystales bacterium]
MDLRFARVAERDESVEDLLEFVAIDLRSQKNLDGIEVTMQPGTTEEGRVLRGPSQSALSGYLQSVLARKPELEPRSNLQLAWGRVVGRTRDGLATTTVRAYWLEQESQLEIARVLDAAVKQDEFTGLDTFVLTLEDHDKQAFGQLTTDALDHMIAVVVGGEVISAPIVRDPIPGGVVHVTMGAAMSAQGPGSAEAFGRSLLGDEWVRVQAVKREDSIGGLRWVWDEWGSP